MGNNSVMIERKPAGISKAEKYERAVKAHVVNKITDYNVRIVDGNGPSTPKVFVQYRKKKTEKAKGGPDKNDDVLIAQRVTKKNAGNLVTGKGGQA